MEKACVWQQLRLLWWLAAKLLLVCWRSRCSETLHITARQYGEVVLPDASTGQGPGTLARKLSRCKEGRRSFCRHGTNFIEHYACRGTSMIGAANLSPITNLLAGTGAVSRYKIDRSQKTVKVYWILITCRCACPGARTITKLSRVQEQKQKL